VHRFKDRHRGYSCLYPCCQHAHAI